MKTSEFNFTLPPDRIATHPVEPRDHARLMVIDRKSGTIQHARFKDLPQWIFPTDLLVLNDTRVIKARLRLPHSGGEIFLIRPESPTRWTAIGRPASALRPGTVHSLELPNQPDRRALEITILEHRESGERLIEFSDAPDLDSIGQMPLPPYIEKAREEQKEAPYQPEDDTDYQTVYASQPGSVAAPTAGLHFTPELLKKFQTASLTLDIGIGTFRPVKEDQVENHAMHSETFHIPESLSQKVNTLPPSPPLPEGIGEGDHEVVEGLPLPEGIGEGDHEVVEGLPLPACPPKPRQRREGIGESRPNPSTDRKGPPPGRVVAVGTTVCRVLESRPQLQPGPGETNIYIYPPYTFQRTDALITNFHLPGSTLIMLVAAFAGLNLQRRAYQTAIDEGYRFYSYGDAMLIL